MTLFLRRYPLACRECQITTSILPSTTSSSKKQYTVVLYPKDKFVVIDFSILKAKDVSGFIEEDVILLMGVEPFSRKLFVEYSMDQKADSVINYLRNLKTIYYENLIFCRSDNGPGFRADSVKKFCKENGMVMVYGRPYRPQGQGSVEHCNLIFKGLLKKMITVDYFRKNKVLTRIEVSQIVSMAASIHNRRPSTITRKSPNNVFLQNMSDIKYDIK